MKVSKVASHVRALERAVRIAGSQSELARRISTYITTTTGTPRRISQSLIWHWLNKATLLDALWWGAIEHATDQQVTRQDLRPDVFGKPRAA